ncbi:hypothetical protein [Nocardioides sp. SYSU DS0663]|uniref:hypothetical protein n=1 Tax=Nocardioides sp. SYSU DS0663 TaxID=3416445 RepID=UPI003F4C1A7C
MGADNDADCVEHVWVLTEIGMNGRALDTTSECGRCGTPRYEPGQAARDARPPLG